jgi:serine/threonine protein kinase
MTTTPTRPDTPITSDDGWGQPSGSILGGRYRISERKSPPGANPEEYDAVQSPLGREVRVLLMRTPTDGRGAAERLLSEARTVSKLDHPVITRWVDFGWDRGLVYWVSERVEGKSLADLIGERGALPVREVLQLLIPIAEALEHAHGVDLAHGGLEAHHVRIDDTGRAKLIDFGLAQMIEAATTAERETRSQIMNRDVRALGKVVVEALSGKIGAAPQEALEGIANIPRRLYVLLERLATEEQASPARWVAHTLRLSENDLSPQIDSDATVQMDPIPRPAAMPPASEPAMSVSDYRILTTAPDVSADAVLIADPNATVAMKAIPDPADAGHVPPELAPSMASRLIEIDEIHDTREQEVDFDAARPPWMSAAIRAGEWSSSHARELFERLSDPEEREALLARVRSRANDMKSDLVESPKETLWAWRYGIAACAIVLAGFVWAFSSSDEPPVVAPVAEVATPKAAEEARALIDQKASREALEKLESAIESGKADAETHAAYAAALAMDDQGARAVEMFDKAASIDPGALRDSDLALIIRQLSLPEKEANAAEALLMKLGTRSAGPLGVASVDPMLDKKTRKRAGEILKKLASKADQPRTAPRS